MFRNLMKCLLIVAALGVTGALMAQPAPYQAVAVIPTNGVSVVWDVPAATYGPLLSLQAISLTNSATFAVKHLIKVTDAIVVTNAVETAAAGATLLSYPADVVYTTNTVPVAKPVLLVPGDQLLFTASATNGGSFGRVIIRAGFPGK